MILLSGWVLVSDPIVVWISLRVGGDVTIRVGSDYLITRYSQIPCHQFSMKKPVVDVFSM